KAAANVFVANKAVKTPTAKSALVLLAVAGVLMIWLGVQGFAYIKTLAMPVKVAIKPDPPVQPPMAVHDSATATVGTSPENTHTIDSRQTSAESAATFASNSGRDRDADNQTSISDTVVEKPNSDVLIASKSKPNSGAVENEAFRKSSGKQLKQSASEVYMGDEAASVNTPKRSQKHTTLQLVSKAPTSGVDPTLLSAYQAFNRGEDASAQQQYRQVLQRDVSNVDALLGMAAIAQRQGRDTDAVGWYQKVLEIEPRNTIAQSAILSSQANADVVGAESRIKSMLALQPDGANLHAALGNLYAAQNQWPAAQEAYFNASRFAPNNADYAFNLAISLDQLGKSNLALKQYERALELLNKSGAASPDRAQLEARIRALQQ
ncbi:MAG: tetratricopeptide repeat protein, partial [Pseudomonadota bacterium]